MKPHEPTAETRAQVLKLASNGVPQKVIARKLDMSSKTLCSHYADELRQGHADAKAQMAGCLFQRGIDGDTTAAIFWAKTRMRWKEAKHDDCTREEKMLVMQCRSLGIDPLSLMTWLSREHARLNPPSPVASELKQAKVLKP